MLLLSLSLLFSWLLTGCVSQEATEAAVASSKGEKEETPITSASTASTLPVPTVAAVLEPTPAQLATCNTTSTIASYSLESELLKDTLTFWIYFPPCYDLAASQTYPVIYLLHGQEQLATIWQELGIQTIADDLILYGNRVPFLIVMPEEEYYYRSPANNRYPDAILTELLPWVEANLPACATQECRAIGGISRGAAWAVRIAFANWDIFGTLGAHSMPLFNGDSEDLPTWLDAIPREELPRIYADVGSSDPAVKDASAFEEVLNTLGVSHEWHLNAGRHNQEYWAQQLPAYLVWYTLPWMEESE